MVLLIFLRPPFLLFFLVNLIGFGRCILLVARAPGYDMEAVKVFYRRKKSHIGYLAEIEAESVGA
jgi:hypothetical protein